MKSRIIIFIKLLFLIGCTSSSSDDNSSVPVPLPATNLTVVGVFTNQINLTWADNSTNETGFKIERKTGTGSFNLIGTVGSNINTFIDSGLAENTQYVYRIYPYNQGGDSAAYSNEVSATTTSQLNMVSVVIGTQIWQKNNLDVVTYRDGTPIPQVTDPTQWQNLTTGAWCYYDNLTQNGVEHGKLYNWYAVAGIYDNASFSNPSLRKELAPAGWHIPSDSEWTTLTNYLGGVSVAGGKMKETGNLFWIGSNTGATNASGFSARASGFRQISSIDGSVSFGNKGSYFYCWSSTPLNISAPSIAIGRYLSNSNTNIYVFNRTIKEGNSVRCIKD
jgi:uncharacterized protein (TIGR02145 family)